MRLLFVGLNYAPEPTGIAPYTAAIAEGLAQDGLKVRVVTTKPHYPMWQVPDGYPGRVRREGGRGGVHVIRLWHYVPGAPSGVRRLVSEISFGLHAIVGRWGRPHVVVLVSPALFASAIALVRARLRRVPSVLWLQDVYSLGIVETAGRNRGGVVARFIRAVESWVVRRADAVCVIHDRFAPVVAALGADPDRVHVVRNWSHVADTPLLHPDVERASLGWGGATVVLHTGAMGRKQDLDNVVEAARICAEDGLNIRFVLTGGGSERARLERAAERLPTIEFLDALPSDRYQAALQAANVLLVNEHAGLREMAVPSKLTSYFSSGRPVLAATDRHSVTAEEILASGGGVRVDPGDPRALIDAVLQLRADPSRCTELGAAGRRYRRSVLSEQAAIAGFERVLDAVAPAGSERPRAPVPVRLLRRHVA